MIDFIYRNDSMSFLRLAGGSVGQIFSPGAGVRDFSEATGFGRQQHQYGSYHIFSRLLLAV
jgi:hypothetical protein